MRGHPPFDYLSIDRYSALGDNPLVVLPAGQPVGASGQAVIVGLDPRGDLAVEDAAAFDLLLTTVIDPPAPWVEVPPARWEEQINALVAGVRSHPMAATILCQTLRLSEVLSFKDALVAESAAYSTLLGGSEFAQWRAATPAKGGETDAPSSVLVERSCDDVTLTLASAATRNAMTASLRDALYAALANVLDDPTKPSVLLKAEGDCFSVGGALDEFGTARDLAEAHIIRTVRSCTSALHSLGARTSVRLHGACIGSGIEIPAAAAHRVATKNAWFQLPELEMGLIPGAGGTVSLTRAIGRHRTAFMALTGKRIPAERALQWGLIHEVVA